MLTLYVSVARNPQNDYTFLHRPMLWINGEVVPANFATYELLECLKSAGYEDDVIDRGQAELLEKGHTVIESNEISVAGLKRAGLLAERKTSHINGVR